MKIKIIISLIVYAGVFRQKTLSDLGSEPQIVHNQQND